MSKFNSMVNNPVNIITTFLWIGFVCAISFMEAWLKFQAPGVTLAVGLGIGQLVFALLNKVEWVFASTVLITLINYWKIKAVQLAKYILPWSITYSYHSDILALTCIGCKSRFNHIKSGY